MSGVRAAGGIAVFWLAVVVGMAGCAVDRSGVPHDGPTKKDVYPEILAGDTPDLVRRKWGEPLRILTFKDERTGAEEEVWQYESRVSADGPIEVVKVTFREGQVRQVERGAVDRRPPDLLRPDSSARRDGL